MSTTLHCLTDFRNLGAEKLRRNKLFANETVLHAAGMAKRIHDNRQAHRPYPSGCRRAFNVTDWIINRNDPKCWPPFNIRTLDLNGLHVPAIKNYQRASNWVAPIASLDRTTERKVDCGRYSSRCNYTHYIYEHRVESWAAVIGKRLYYRIDTFHGLFSSTLDPPRGWKWELDDFGGVAITANDGKAEYHPSAHELLTFTPRELAAKARENARARREIDRYSRIRSREAAAEEAAFNRLADQACVTLHDSKCAGNFAAGTIRWAQQKLGVRIDSRNPYQVVPGRSLLATNEQAAKRAVVAALRRETMVSI